MCVCHRCDNPICVNPAHLFIGTQADNMADMYSKGRGVKARHLVAQESHFAKLSNADIPKILSMKSAGVQQKDIAITFNVSRPTISAIVNRKSWLTVITTI